MFRLQEFVDREHQLEEEKRLINEHADQLKESLKVQNSLLLLCFDAAAEAASQKLLYKFRSVVQVDSAFYPLWDDKMKVSFWVHKYWLVMIDVDETPHNRTHNAG